MPEFSLDFLETNKGWTVDILIDGEPTGSTHGPCPTREEAERLALDAIEAIISRAVRDTLSL